MKKILSFLFLLVVAVSLVACRDNGGDEPSGEQPAARTYVADGKYTAFAANDNDGAPQLTWVTVTIKDDKIESFYIDELQTKDGVWNEKTKKELKFDYNMAAYGTDKDGDGEVKEWFEQAAIIEAQFMTSLDLTTDADGYITGLSGATIKDHDYSKLAKQAVENAKNGVVTTLLAGSNQVAFATAKVNAEGKLSNVVLDVRQITDGVWRDKTKQELGYEYGMKDAAVDKNGDGITLEWFEQAALIVEGWMNGTITNDISVNSQVTISNSGYTDVLNKLVADGWKK